ncbi:MAG: glycosyltransferase family 2 protein [Lachnospiraceae bacterium]|nr:glycosyltransferase family 2 protein [Lachnospiraceae bacterium]
MATISVCMIVKNEEAVLARCLDSLQGLYEELIIVDTGSTDATKQIAAKYTDKVYDFAWTGSFSDARNFSFSKAGCEYIYVADADEVIDEKNRKRFLFLKEALIPEVEIVQMYYGNQLSQNSIYNFDQELRPKLYKRQREFIWQEPIHEAVRLQPVVFDSDIVITHLPEGEHGSRDLEAFERMLEKGEEISDRLRDIYLRELYFMGQVHNLQKAHDYLEELCRTSEPDSDAFQQAIALLCRGAALCGDQKNLLKYGLKGVATKGSSELCMELGRFFQENQDYEEAMLWYHNAANETESLMSLAASTTGPGEGMAECMKALGIKREV